jgi:hypothetical protein
MILDLTGLLGPKRIIGPGVGKDHPCIAVPERTIRICTGTIGRAWPCGTIRSIVRPIPVEIEPSVGRPFTALTGPRHSIEKLARSAAHGLTLSGDHVESLANGTWGIATVDDIVTTTRRKAQCDPGDQYFHPGV